MMLRYLYWERKTRWTAMASEKASNKRNPRGGLQNDARTVRQAWENTHKRPKWGQHCMRWLWGCEVFLRGFYRRRGWTGGGWVIVEVEEAIGRLWYELRRSGSKMRKCEIFGLSSLSSMWEGKDLLFFYRLQTWFLWRDDTGQKRYMWNKGQMKN
jgi:hypothetical protein